MDFISDKLSDAFFQFISKNLEIETSRLRLSVNKNTYDFDVDLAITQIECRKKYKKKLKGFFNNPEFIVPSSLAGEQATHEAVALYHASLLNESDVCVDVTAGLGIDSMSMAKRVKNIISIEQDSLKASCLDYNKDKLGLTNLKVINQDSLSFLRSTDIKFNVVYADPARRDLSQKRVFGLEDSFPSVSELMECLKNRPCRVLIKCSPMIDITQTLLQLGNIVAVYVISVDGECKEVLIDVDNMNNSQEDGNKEKNIIGKAVNLNPDGSIKHEFKTIIRGMKNDKTIEYIPENYDYMEKYLYEPDASVMKFSPWNDLQADFPGLLKMAPSSHLFVSEHLYEKFPGRVLRIEKNIENKKDRNDLKNIPANIVSRNHPLTPDLFRKKLGIKEGCEKFIYLTTDNSGKHKLLLTTLLINS